MRNVADSKWKRRRNQGFTMVELIVVIVIILILSGLSVFGITRWIRWSRFKQQNEYARTLFAAAQNQLTEYSESGQLEKLGNSLDTLDLQIASGTKKVNGYHNPLEVQTLGIVDSEGNDYALASLDLLWPESAGKGAAYRGSICSIIGTPEDFAAYQAKNADTVHQILYDILTPYLYDQTILNSAVVCLEFTPGDGQVYSVLYSDDSGVHGFTYGADEGSTKSIQNRTKDARYKRMIGYYGVDTLYKATSLNATKPTLSNVMLNNEETLNLSFRVGKAPLNELLYEIRVYDKELDTEYDQLHFQIDAKEFTAQQKGMGFAKQISCEVYKFVQMENGEPKYIAQPCNLVVYLDEKTENTLHVILDGADQSATSAAFYEAFEALTSVQEGAIRTGSAADDFLKTMSFHRFGIDAENIYCKVRATGTFYKTSAMKSSNTENAYFASGKLSRTDGEETFVHTLKNARHLYNMRYLEDIELAEAGARDEIRTFLEKSASAQSYQAAADFSWSSFYEAGWYFDRGAGSYQAPKPGTRSTGRVSTVLAADAFFPSIKTLRETSVLSGSGSKTVTIDGLKIDAAHNPKALYGEGDPEAPSAGLFLLNQGTIKKLALDTVTVSGIRDVGAFCGVSEGSLQELEIKNTESEKTVAGETVKGFSRIRGQENVGGAAGRILDRQGEEAEASEIVNRAIVTGLAAANTEEKNQKIGGIVGAVLEDGSGRIEISKCKNYGQVEAAALQDECIGGIVGKADGKNGSILLSECTSSPQYAVSQGKVGLVTTGADGKTVSLKEKLLGRYVGGIVGYNTGAALSDCSTRKNKKDGYVFGDTYVGGIVGFNDNDSETGMKRIAGKSTGNGYGLNEANVLGNSYVGGIIGFNSNHGIIANWKNSGFVGATTAYAGGIVGSNGDNTRDGFSMQPVISNCNIEMTVSAGIRMLENDALFKTGDYIGGIAGYNDGIITSYYVNDNGEREGSASRISSVSDVTGRSFVGGIVGYNDWNAEVDGYAVIGGNIVGTGSFVGGYAGFNSSRYMLETKEGIPCYLQSNPNQVKGAFCVGGTFGGNVLQLGAETETVKTAFSTDNFLGEMRATAVAGGFIGYNQIVGDSVQKQDVKREITEFAQTSAASASDYLACLEKLPNLEAGKGTFIITGTDDAENTQAWLGGITAKLYAAGVIGYNEEQSHLTIQNVVNRSPITATEAVPAEEAPYNEAAYDGSQKLYSYAGGIIGKVSKNTVIDHCKNQGSGRVTAEKATYTGGICEINEGTIKNCLAVSQSGRDYVGGIAGINVSVLGTPGLIESCTLSGELTGGNYVGGIVSENYGTIRDCLLEKAKITATGQVGYVGLMAASNRGNGEILLAQEYKAVSVRSSGDYVGGLVGENAGTLTLAEDADRCRISGTVSGRSVVGGFVGSHKGNGEIYGVESEAVVTAENGTVGGIAGESEAKITGCTNLGVITAAREGNAGGIVAENRSGIIESCTDYGQVIAAGGDCGGITSINGAAGVITGCRTIGKDAVLTFESPYQAGGICAKNSGTIQQSTVENLLIRNIAKAGASDVCLGGITGINTGSIETDGTMVKKVEISSATDKACLGGIAGRNSAALRGNGSSTADQVGISFNGVYANVGGAVGENSGTLTELDVYADITGTFGAEAYGYGGIAGINGGSLSGCSFSGQLKVDGQASAIANVGGIAGINRGSLSGCVVGTRADVSTVIQSGLSNQGSGFAYLGGLVGWNFGRVLSCDNVSRSTSPVSIVGYKGHTGGLIGFEAETGSVVGTEAVRTSTGAGWSVRANEYSNDCGTGGIIGYNESGIDIQYVDNHAVVSADTSKGNVTVGGFIGRSQNKYVLTAKIIDCVNYGDVSGRLVGGFLGRGKYKMFSFENCYNYGTIKAIEAAGGIVGDVYMAESDGYSNFVNCRNFGEINGPADSSGGIFGKVDGTSKVKLVFTDCVNEGYISSGSGGIAGRNASGASSFYRCRNYGNSPIATFNGIAGARGTAMVDCISLGVKQNLIPDKPSVFARNYYLSSEILDIQEGSGIYLSSSVTHSGGILNNFTNIGASRTTLNLGNSASPYVRFDLMNEVGDAAEVGNIGILMAGNGTSDVFYNFTVSVQTETGEAYLVQNESETALGSAENAYEYAVCGMDSNPAASYWSASFPKQKITSVTLHFTLIQQGRVTQENGESCFTGTGAIPQLQFYRICASADTQALDTASGYYTFVKESSFQFKNLVAVSADVNLTGGAYNQGDKTLFKVYPGNGKTQILGKAFWGRQVYLMSDKNKGMSFDFVMKAPVSISGFQILMANNSDTSGTGEIRRYEYDTTVFYTDGSSETVSGTKIGTHRDVVYDDNNLIDVICDPARSVEKITLKVKKVYRDGAPTALNNYVCFWGIWAYRDTMPDIQRASGVPVYLNTGISGVQAPAVSIYQTASSGGTTTKLGLPSNEKQLTGTALWKIIGEGNFVLTNITAQPKALWGDNTRYLLKAAETEKKARQKVYESIEIGDGSGKAPIEVYYDSLSGKTDPKALSITQVTAAANTLTCDWKLDLNDTAYDSSELVYVVKRGNTVAASNEDAPITLAYGISQYKMPIPADWIGCDITFYVRACSSHYAPSEYTESFYPTGAEAAQPGASVWAEKTVPVKETLPTPKVHVELVDPSNFMVVLDNPEDFEGKAVKITAKVDGSAKTITKTVKDPASSGNMSALFAFASKNNNINLEAYAESTDASYAKSVTLVLQTAFYGTSDLKNTTYYNTVFNDFYGTQTDNMYESLKIESKHNFTELYLNTELEIKDYKVGDQTVPVIVSFGDPHITFSSGILQVALGNLPSDLLSYHQIAVRTYPWLSQSNVVHYGHMVAEGIGEAELIRYLKGEAELTDPGRGETALRNVPVSVFENGTPAPGYKIRKNQDETYDIYYSSILNFRADGYEKQIYEKNYEITPSTDEARGTVTAAGYEKPIYRLPQIDPECTYTDASYSFSWNEGESTGAYALKLYGISADGSRVLLDTAETQETAYTFENAEKNWNFSELELEVSQIGKADKNNKTEIFPSAAEESFKIKLKFSQITKPVSTLHKENDGTVQKNALIYDVNWTAIPETERASGELASYEVTVKWQSHDAGVVKPFDSDLAFVKALTLARTLYEGRMGGEAPERITGTAVFGWMEGEETKTEEVSLSEAPDVLKGYLEKEAVTCSVSSLGDITGETYQWIEAGTEKTLTLAASGQSGSLKLEKQLDETRIVSADAAAANCSTSLDLADYERGDTVLIAVRALAAETAVKYRDGLDGVKEELKLPSRLDVPDVTILQMEETYAADAFCTLQEFEAGLTLRYTPAAGTVSALVAGRYQLAAAIFDAKEAPDTTKRDPDSWSSGALTVLAGKDELGAAPTITMDGTFYDSEQLLENLSPQYAGKWLKVAMRSVSDSNISSYWSDEDDDTEGTVNDQWIRIPRVRIADPEITTGTRDLAYEVKGEPVSLTQTELTISAAEYADAYHITRIHESAGIGGLGDTAYTAKYADDLYLKKNADGTIDVYFTSGDPALEIPERISANLQSGNAALIAKQNAGNTLTGSALYYLGTFGTAEIQIPSVQTFYDSKTDSSITPAFTVRMETNAETGEISVKLTLPDVEKIEKEEVDKQYLFSGEVAVQNLNIAEKDRYADSKLLSWYRSMNADKEMIVSTVLLEKAELSKGIALGGFLPTGAALSMLDGIYCQADLPVAENWLVYRVRILDSTGAIAYEGDISAYAGGVAGSAIHNVLLLPERFASCQGGQLQILAVAAVVDAGSGSVPAGLTEWYQFTGQIPSYQLPEKQEETDPGESGAGTDEAAGGAGSIGGDSTGGTGTGDTTGTGTGTGGASGSGTGTGGASGTGTGTEGTSGTGTGTEGTSGNGTGTEGTSGNGSITPGTGDGNETAGGSTGTDAAGSGETAGAEGESPEGNAEPGTSGSGGFGEAGASEAGTHE